MILPIYLYGAEVLREKAAEVTEQNRPEDLKQFIEDMKETMLHADGCGLAAPQVGKSLRILVVDGSGFKDQFPELVDFRRTMINPVILAESESTVEYSEGCLSIPDVDANVTRPEAIRVRYLDEDMKEQEEQFDGFGCRMIQHEYDHLEGIMFTDRATPIRKKLIANKLNGISKGNVRCSYKVRTDKKII